MKQTEQLTEEEVSEQHEFYVVSLKKFVTLFLGTLGWYTIYWFYKNWSLYKTKNQTSIWPIMGASFAIFFTHSLFALFEDKYKEQTGTESKSLNNVATIFVIFVLVGNISDRLASDRVALPLTMCLSLCVLPINCWALYSAQKVANVACGDANGSSNEKLSKLNILFLFLGGALWLLSLLWIYVTTTDV